MSEKFKHNKKKEIKYINLKILEKQYTYICMYINVYLTDKLFGFTCKLIYT